MYVATHRAALPLRAPRSRGSERRAHAATIRAGRRRGFRYGVVARIRAGDRAARDRARCLWQRHETLLGLRSAAREVDACPHALWPSIGARQNLTARIGAPTLTSTRPSGCHVTHRTRRVGHHRHARALDVQRRTGTLHTVALEAHSGVHAADHPDAGLTVLHDVVARQRDVGICLLAAAGDMHRTMADRRAAAGLERVVASG